MEAITTDDIRRAVSDHAFEAGHVYRRQGRVATVRPRPADTGLEARVRGSARTPYQLEIEVSRDQRGRLLIMGSCSCPVGFNCKHVAAALLVYVQHKPPPTQVAGRRLAPVSASNDTVQSGPAAVVDRPLPPDVDAWLRRLDAAQEVETEDYPPTVRKRLLYVLHRGGTSNGVVVDLHSIDLKADGRTNGRSRRYRPQPFTQPDQLPKFLRPSDRAILRRLGPGVERGDDFIATLQAIIATGRGRWAEWDGPVLALGDPMPATIAWTLGDDGGQRPVLQLPPGLMPLHLDETWYADPSTGAMGPVEAALPDRVLRTMLSSPALLPETAARVRDELGRRWPQHRLPAPAPVQPPEPIGAPLQPVLSLLRGELPFDPTRVAYDRYGRFSPTPAHDVPLARLSWCYGPVTLQANESRDLIKHEGRLLRPVRDTKGETQAVDRLRGLGFGRITHYLPPAHRHAADLALLEPDPGAWIAFMLDELPDLQAEGWAVEVAADFPVRLASSSGELSVEIRESSGIDWFDIDLGIMVDGVRVNLTPALLNLIADAGLPIDPGADDTDDAPPPVLLPLADGRLLAVPFARLRPVLAPLLELFAGADLDLQADAIRLSRRNSADLAILEQASSGAGVVWSGGEAVRALGRQLRDHGGLPPCPAPSGFGAMLRPYQAHGLAWLQFLRAAELGGILADDMGLGKTVQALAHLAVEQEAGRLTRPALVVCPTSLVPNWRAEASRFAPTLSTLVLHGPDRADRFAAIPRHDLVITTYPLLARDHAVLTAQDWHIVVLDEAQTIKNPLATTSKLARTLRARQRLCLSGTPLENHLGELWSMYDFLMPGFLGDRQGFGRRFRAPIEKDGDLERRALLARRIAPFLMRRAKAEVAPELPAKTEIAEAVEMGEAQRAIYEGIRLAMQAKVRAAIARRGLAGSGIIILDALLKLRQACCDPRLLKLQTAKAAKAGSAKFDRLFELLPQLLEEGRRVLLFSQFTSMLSLIEAELVRLALPYVLLTGDTRNRTVPVRRFQAGEVPLFLISLKAGGVGLNLTAADTVIHYDPWWNPAVEDQATDRAHRIGQDKPVFVHRLITQGSIEEKMQTLKQRKQALAAGILQAGAGAALTLTEADLDTLFAPLDG